MPASDPDDLGALAARLAEEAGALLLEGRHDVRTTIETKSSGTDMVTEMDRAAERLITRRLAEERPHDGILGEEGADVQGTSGVRWIVDPLDGTTNYLYGFLAFGVSVAAEVDGRVVAGAVCDPVHAETFTAVLGRGARRNGVALGVTGSETLATALVGTGFAYDAGTRAAQGDVLRRVLPQVRDIRRAGAAALDLCWVGAGRLDGFFERGLKPWDWAAGSLVASEAGARTAVVDGDLHLAAAPHLFDPLLAIVV